jgi:hypothetical protein
MRGAGLPHDLPMAALHLIAWPFHAGLLDVGMGLGPTVLVEDERLRAALRGAG